MFEDPNWVAQFLWFKKTGRPPLEFEDYDTTTLIALIADMDRKFERESLMAEQEDQPDKKRKKPWGPPTLADLDKAQWDTAYATGDAQVDAWERQIAKGKTPDLEE